MNQLSSLITPRLAPTQHSGPQPRIALLAASWHADIVARATGSFVESLAAQLPQAQCDLMHVPGVLEIPLQAKLLAQSGQYDVIVAFGLIVDGGIYRHDFVSTAVIDGLMRVQLDTLVPVLSVVLTPHHFHSSEEHHHFFYEHFVVKGREAANACAQVLQGWQARAEEGQSAANSHWTQACAVVKPLKPQLQQAQAVADEALRAAEESKPAVWSVRGAQSTTLNSSN
ncbi:6,7-dimethyl-8-ribityllumazine synthase [Lampropedia aestuarii]|uniref:6,7-dimethyl-8-ribityllumazine synthase n=1 Tax=Lampropedia aestuarii TaxID=2562762 RepID=A0A4S5BYM2_9BURK|nr:6,7-dimethyl-8-ribityllumazine synthase [Lampropedia aestuarii]